MKQIAQAFTEHPRSVGETYWQHMGQALSFAGPLLVASICALVHAFLPFLFVKTGSTLITRLHQRMVLQRVRRAERSFGEEAPRY